METPDAFRVAARRAHARVESLWSAATHRG
jgi:hypothetical protein